MAVVELLARQHCCLTAQEIFDQLREDGRGAGIASIYRTLDLLTRTGLVRRVELGPAACYEPAHPGGEHHHHVVCDRCGKVSSFEDPALEDAIARLATPPALRCRRARCGAEGLVPRLPVGPCRANDRLDFVQIAQIGVLQLAA